MASITMISLGAEFILLFIRNYSPHKIKQKKLDRFFASKNRNCVALI
jgi:hypothetical protein